MFGTPHDVIYGGCAHGANFDHVANDVSESDLTPTNIIRFVGAQSVDEESFDIDFSNLRVWTNNDGTIEKFIF